jgi:CheY-like chemotaxis protein
MGKKILTEAGYEVVAVSNGAAAVKKIAELKPDVIILDVYMPGYSGLEVCEKVRGSLDTAKTPVLLTVGKMEPYNPEDANRVKADGVIIKPFEASDLLAIIKKFEERIAQQTPVPPMVEQTIRLERQYHEEAIAVSEPPMEHTSTGKTGMQPMVEVPDHMAGSAAFNDMLGPDSTIGPQHFAPQHFAVNTPSAAFETSVIVPAPPVPPADYDLPVSWEEEEKAEPAATEPVESAPEIIATPVADSPEPVAAVAEPEVSAVPVEASEPEPAHPQFIPVFKEPEPEATAYEVMPTSAPPTGEMEISPEPGLQERAEETTRNTVADRVEPGLMSTIEQQVAGFPTPPLQVSASVASASVEANAEGTAETVPEVSYSVPLPRVDATSEEEVSDSDFEARVAAAMAAYNHTAEAAPVLISASEIPVTDTAEAASATSGYAAQAVEAVAEPAPSFEYRPPVNVPEPAPATHTASETAEVAAEPVPPTPEPVAPEPAAVHDAIAAGVEAAAAAAAAETEADHQTITQAVHRVMERLKPELVEEIMRELKAKK